MKNLKLQKKEWLVSYLEIGGIEFIQDQYTVTISDDVDLDDLLEDAFSAGRDIEVQNWTKPEEFQLANKYADILKGAIDNHVESYCESVNSIKIINTEGNTKIIEIRPTKVTSLFNIFREYGKLVEKQSKETASS